MRRLFASLLCLASILPAAAEPISISTKPVLRFSRLPGAAETGPLEFRGGLVLSSAAEHFGGFSGLVLDRDCERLTAVSDEGHWLRARLGYDGPDLSTLSGATLEPMRDAKGRPLATKARGDAEALVRLRSGQFLAAFESLVRFGRYDIEGIGFAAPFRAVPHPKDIDTGPGNAEVEAVGELPDGRLIAAAEGQFDAAGNIRAWAWKDWRTAAFAIERFGGYRITDMAVLEDGGVLTLERRFGGTSLPGMAIRRFEAGEIAAGGLVRPRLLLEATAPLQVIDNMEGIAVCMRGGETRVTLVSDDNFNRSVQRTILLQFAYRP